MQRIETEHGFFTNNEVTGQTAQEVYQEWLEKYYYFIDGEWVKKEQIDICPPKTLEQRLEEAEQKLVETEQRLTESEEEKKLLKAQVEANTSTQEFLESCLMEIAEVVYA